MKKFKLYLSLIALTLSLYTEGGYAQNIALNNGAKLVIGSGGFVVVPGNVTNSGANTALTNNGTLITEGNLQNTSNALIQGNGTYKVGGNWNNSATFTAGTSLVELIGNTPATIVSGDNPFYYFILNKGTANPIVNVSTNAVSIAFNLVFSGTNNKIQLNGLNLTVGGNIYGNDPSKYVITNGTGKLIIAPANNYYFAFPIGTSSTSFTPLSVALNQLNGTVRLGARVQQWVYTGGTTGTVFPSGVVNKSWFVTQETTIPALDFTITPQWNSPTDEASGFVPTLCGVSRWTGSGWDLTPSGLGPSTGTSTRFRSRTGVTNFGLFIVGSSNAVLPLTLLDFTAKTDNKAAFMAWKTANEHDMSHFDIERSIDAKQFTKIGDQKAGYTEGYAFTDNAAFEQVNAPFYRLKMVDNNGQFTFSPIRQVVKSSDDLKIYPNPVANILTIDNATGTNITLTNSIGQVLITTKVAKSVDIHVGHLPSGVYFIQTDKGKQRFIKL